MTCTGPDAACYHTYWCIREHIITGIYEVKTDFQINHWYWRKTTSLTCVYFGQQLPIISFQKHVTLLSLLACLINAHVALIQHNSMIICGDKSQYLVFNVNKHRPGHQNNAIWIPSLCLSARAPSVTTRAIMTYNKHVHAHICWDYCN